jgi:Bacterial PH domain
MGTLPAGREKRAEAVGGAQTFRSPTAVLIWWIWLLFAAANLIDLAVQGRDYASLVGAAILVLATGVAYVTAQRPRIIADDAGITIRNPLRDHHIGWAGVTRIDLADLLRVHTQPSQGDQSGKVISSWAVHYSRRHKLLAESRARRGDGRASSSRSPLGLPYGGSGGYGDPPASASASPAQEEAEKIVRLLSEHATAARAEAVWAQGSVPVAGLGSEAGQADAQAGQAGQAGQAAGQAGQAGQAAGQAAGTEAASQTGMDPRWLEPLTSTWSRTAIAALLIPALILLVVSLL